MLPVVLEARHWRKLTKSRLSQVFFLGKHKSSGTLSKKSFSIASLFSIFLYNWKSFSINYNLIGSSGCSFLLIGFLQYCPSFCYLLKGNFIWIYFRKYFLHFCKVGFIDYKNAADIPILHPYEKFSNEEKGYSVSKSFATKLMTLPNKDCNALSANFILQWHLRLTSDNC